MEQTNANADTAECGVIEREFSDGHWICERPSGHGGQHKFVWRFLKEYPRD